MNTINEKNTGCDHNSNYSYFDIKDYDTCCTCEDFYDNEIETRFECHTKSQCGDCYKNKYEDEF